MSNLRTPFQAGFGSGGARLTDGVLKKNIAQVRDEFDVLVTVTDAVAAGAKAYKVLADASANTLRLDAIMPGQNGNEMWVESVRRTTAEAASVFDITLWVPDLSTTIGKFGYPFATTHATELCTYGTMAAPVVHGFTTGDGPFRLETATTLPAGYALTALYWVIVVNTTTFKLATTKVLALAETATPISDDGSGIHRIFPMAKEVFSGLSTTITAERYMEKAINGGLGVSFTAAATTDICTTAVAHNMSSGDGPYRVGTTGTIPTGLSELLEYYIIALDAEPILSATTFQLATTRANALAGTQVELSGAGSGTHRLYKVERESGSLGSNWVTAQDLLSGTTEDRPTDTTAGVPAVFAGGTNEVTATGVNRGDYVVRALSLTTSGAWGAPAAIAKESVSCTFPDKLVTTAGIGASLVTLFTIRPKP
jgi:hypothetical protein